MTLHVYNNPTGTNDTSDGINVWVTDVPPDFTDSDVRYNVEEWAKGGDKVAQLALQIEPGYWLDMGGWERKDPTVRVYVDR